jgi:cation diffusion facilitator family transporter
MVSEIGRDDLVHDHVFLGPGHDDNARRTSWVVVITGVMMVAEIVAGLTFNSMALLADGFHMATHAGALGVAVFAYAYARRHARNRRYSFGTGKVGDLAGFASALILGVVAFGIAVESVLRLVEPSPVAFGEAALIAIVGLGVNVVSALLLAGGQGHHHAHDHGHGHAGRHHHGHAHDHHHHGRDADNNLRSAYFHVLADALTSVLAIVALTSGYFFGWVWLDPAMGIIGAIVIASWSWRLVRETAAVLLDVSDVDLERKIRAKVEGPGDTRITDLHVWRVGPGAAAVIVAVTGTDGRVVRERLAAVHGIRHLTVEAR